MSRNEGAQSGTNWHKPADVVATVRQADVLIARAQSATQVIRCLGLAEVTNDRRRED